MLVLCSHASMHAWTCSMICTLSSVSSCSCVVKVVVQWGAPIAFTSVSWSIAGAGTSGLIVVRNLMVTASAVWRRDRSAWLVRAAIRSILEVAGGLGGTLTALGVACFTRSCVKPTQVSHKLNIWHVSQLWVVLESTLDVLTLDWTHANVLDLAVLQELTIVTVLVLNDLMDVLRGWGCSVLGHFLLLHGWLEWALWETRLKLGLLALLVSFAVVVRDFKDFFQALWRLHYALITRGWVF